ncbi:MAG: hypothetical protein V1702_06250 [Candidatus Woesearchaeota archaeon]
MNDIIKNDLLAVINDAEKLVLKRDSFGLHELSDHTVHNASIFQDEDSILIAVVTYALSKVIARGSGDIRIIAKMLDSAGESLKKDDIGSYRGQIRRIVERISAVDSKMRLYIKNVIEQAEIKKGFKLFDHGISAARAAKVLGITQWELMSYIGNTNVFDENIPVMGVRERVALARRLFR